jgi:hypothetical protein
MMQMLDQGGRSNESSDPMRGMETSPSTAPSGGGAGGAQAPAPAPSSSNNPKDDPMKALLEAAERDKNK